MYNDCFIFTNQNKIHTETSHLHWYTSSLLYDEVGQAVSLHGDHCKYPSLVKIGQNPTNTPELQNIRCLLIFDKIMLGSEAK